MDLSFIFLNCQDYWTLSTVAIVCNSDQSMILTALCILFTTYDNSVHKVELN